MARRHRSDNANEVRWIGSGRRGHMDGDSHIAELNRPFGICALHDGTLAFTDAHNNAVRFVISETRRGVRRCYVKTVESSGLLTPKGIAASSDERHFFVCDTGHHKIKLAALPSRSALADIGSIIDEVEMFAFAGNGKKGWRDGPALEASFNSPAGVCECPDGTIIVADTGNHCIRQIRRAVNGKLVVKTIAGAHASLEAKRGDDTQRFEPKRVSGYRDGVRSLFRGPSAIIAGPHGELLVADTMNNRIRGLLPPSGASSSWKVSTICGQDRPGYGDGNCEVALLDQPISLCWGVDTNTFFVVDRGNACIRQVGRHYGNDLSYAWVRTIEVGCIPQAPHPVRSQELSQYSHPLGIVCMYHHDEEAVCPQLVVCDGGDNIIKMIPLEGLEQHVLDTKGRFDIPKLSDRSTFPQSRSESRSCYDLEESLSPVSMYSDSQGLSENQFRDGGRICSCGASQALEEALKANAALQAENLRLKELLQCTFDEIELADKRFSENYQPQID
ncbi:hypothetical protein JG687_00008558 [Phytophthora cactorum]|uniref:NHL repeat-containing protein n=2 Tax=Phytophthora cactorum TaxID=29920 RepID=A0A329RV76_9STRA|nr:hypothetical protein Pcac1_g22547 [Phytophthora cactorum]KAG2843414.1 hypothetical protein PC112_g2664 [Phytophthora cactorum]KAG2867429.1 hypothetical protein PC113_g1990 [Phytophthora cactorum]KAG2942527.1 hypothetical protein PC115_g1413 [Phytophthora cactorum]KAG2953434.1 hypothetical protein PC117_g2039 [Phytophthora cactorum]